MHFRHLDLTGPRRPFVGAESNVALEVAVRLQVVGTERHQPHDFPGLGISIDQQRIPLEPRLPVGGGRIGGRGPRVSEVVAPPMPCRFRRHQLAVAKVSKTRGHSSIGFSLCVHVKIPRLGPCCAPVVARHQHGAMRVIAADQHQQPILFRHVDEVGHCHDAIPLFGDDLQLGGNGDLRCGAVELPHRVRLPRRCCPRRPPRLWPT